MTFIVIKVHGNGSSEIVVRYSKELQSLPEGSNTVEIDIESFSGRLVTLGNILEHATGVYTSRSNGLEQKEGLAIRGFSGNQVKVLLDGMPISEKGGEASDLSQIPIDTIDKIIISKGPMSGLYGSGAMGGVVNVITKKKINKSKLSYLIGSFNTQNIFGQVFQNFESLRVSVIGFSKFTRGDFKFKNQKFNDLYDRNQSKYLEIENNQTEEFGGKVSFTSNRSVIPVNLSLELNRKKNGIPGRTTQGFKSISESTLFYRSQASLNNYKIGRNILNMDLYHKNSVRSYNDPLGEYNGFPEKFRTTTDGIGANIEVLHPIFSQVSQKIGLSTETEAYKNEEIDLDRKIFKATNVTEFLLLDEDLSITPYCSIVTATDLETEAPFGISMFYRLTENFSFKTNLSRGFRYPTFDELFLSRGMFVGNPELKSENSFGGDMGLEYKIKQWEFVLSYFLYEATDQIEYLLVSGFQYKPFNFKKTLTEGFEVKSKFSPYRFLVFNTSFTFQNVLNRDSEGDFYNRFVPNKPRVYGVQKVEILYAENFIFFTELTLALQRYTNRANSKKTTDRVLTNLGIRYAISNNLSSSVEIKNIFDEYNLDIRGFPLPERSFYASLSYSF